MKAVKQTLDERCNETIEEIYKIAIKLIIETIADGYGDDAADDNDQGPPADQGRRDDNSGGGGGGVAGSSSGSGDAESQNQPNAANQNKATGDGGGGGGKENKDSSGGGKQAALTRGRDATAGPSDPATAAATANLDPAKAGIGWRKAGSQSCPSGAGGRLKPRLEPALIRGLPRAGVAIAGSRKRQPNGLAAALDDLPSPLAPASFAGACSSSSGTAEGANLAKSRPAAGQRWPSTVAPALPPRGAAAAATGEPLGAGCARAEPTAAGSTGQAAASAEHERRIRQTLAILGQLLSLVSGQQQRDAADKAHQAREPPARKVGEHQQRRRRNQKQADDNDSQGQIGASSGQGDRTCARPSPKSNEICLASRQAGGSNRARSLEAIVVAVGSGDKTGPPELPPAHFNNNNNNHSHSCQQQQQQQRWCTNSASHQDDDRSRASRLKPVMSRNVCERQAKTTLSSSSAGNKMKMKTDADKATNQVLRLEFGAGARLEAALAPTKLAREVCTDNDLAAAAAPASIATPAAGQPLGALQRSRQTPLAQAMQRAEISEINNDHHHQRRGHHHYGHWNCELASRENKLQRSISLTSLAALREQAAPSATANQLAKVIKQQELSNKSKNNNNNHNHKQREQSKITDQPQWSSRLMGQPESCCQDQPNATCPISNAPSAGEPPSRSGVASLSANSAELLQMIQMLLSTIANNKSFANSSISNKANQLLQATC